MPGIYHSSTKATNIISYLRSELSFSFEILHKCISIYSLRILYMHTVYINHVHLLRSPTTPPRSPPHFPFPTSPLFLKTHWVQLVLPICGASASPSSRWFPDKVKWRGAGRVLASKAEEDCSKTGRTWQDSALRTRGACGCLPLRPALDQANQNSSVGQGEAHEAHPKLKSYW